MANPYKKAEQVQKKTPGSRPETVKQEPVVAVPEVKEEPVVQVVAAPAEPVVVKDNFLDGIIETKPRGKSYGFYLDDEVVAALEKLAKQKKSSKSKVLNTILRNVLLN